MEIYLDTLHVHIGDERIGHRHRIDKQRCVAAFSDTVTVYGSAIGRSEIRHRLVAEPYSVIKSRINPESIGIGHQVEIKCGGIAGGTERQIDLTADVPLSNSESPGAPTPPMFMSRTVTLPFVAIE